MFNCPAFRVACFGKDPRGGDFTPDPLPLSGAGKILKAELRRPFWERKEKAVH